jgi:hypothetical protein
VQSIEQSIEEDNAAPVRNSRQRSTAPTKFKIEISSNKGRVTRSTKRSSPHYELSPPKRRSGVAAAQEQPSKRQRSTSHESAEEGDLPQPDQEDEEVAEDEEHTPPKEFFDGINESLGASIVPNKRPTLKSNASVKNPAENDNTADQIDTSDEVNVGGTIIAATEEQHESRGSVRDSAEPEVASGQLETVQSEVPQSAQPVSHSNTLQRESLKSARQKRRRPREKASYDELNLSSELSPDRSTQPTASRNTQFDESVYDVPDSPQKPSNQTALAEESQKAPMSTGGGSRKTKQGKQRSSQSGQRKSNASTRHQDDEQQEGHSQEENGEHGDHDFDPSDSEPESNQELDMSYLAQDSLVLDAPPDDPEAAASVATIRMKRAYVQKLMHIMTLRGWMEGRLWKNDFLEQAAEKSKLLANEPDCPLPTRILVRLFKLYELCKKIPQSPKLDQLAYLREHAVDFGTLISNLRQSIDVFSSKINDIMEGATPEQVSTGFRSVAKLRRRIIPMLVLILDTTFEAGCRAPLENGQKAAQQTGEFTVYLLQPLERAAGWARRLSQIMEGWYELHPPTRERDNREEARENRAAFHTAIVTLKQELKNARNDLDRPKVAPEVLMQKDEAIRKEREVERQQYQEKKDLQMQRFLHSIQRINPYGQPAGARPIRQVPTHHQQNLTSSAPSQKLSEQSHYEQHGWHYWEDDRILSLIRTTAHPNYDNYRYMLPDRSPDELRERSRYLKLVARNKYERKGIAPPGWCIDED